MKYLYAAYAATWAIHIFYLLVLTRGFRRLGDDIEELKRE